METMIYQEVNVLHLGYHFAAPHLGPCVSEEAMLVGTPVFNHLKCAVVFGALHSVWNLWLS